MTRSFTLLLIVVLASPVRVGAQASPDVWRTVAEKIDAGSEVHVRLRDRTRFRATLLEARTDGVLLHPRTRVPVEVQEVRYQDIVSLERRRQGGMSAGKAVGIGIASGVGAFFAVFAILVAVYGD
jgi:hypothetical protein